MAEFYMSEEESSYEEDMDNEDITVLKPKTVLIENDVDSNTDSDNAEPLANLKPETSLMENENNEDKPSSDDSEKDKKRKNYKLDKNVMEDDDDDDHSNTKEDEPSTEEDEPNSEDEPNTDEDESNTDEDEPLIKHSKLDKTVNEDDDDLTNTEGEEYNTDEEPMININLKTEVMENSDDDDADDTKSNTDNDENYETESEYSMSAVDYEPAEKRSYQVVPQMNAHKNPYIKSAQYIYSKFVIRQCPMCEFEFNSAHCWKKHLKFMHQLEKPEHLQFKYNERGAKCKLCNYQTAAPNFNKLLDHEIVHMPNTHYLKCQLCDWKTKTHSSMNFHLRAQHAEAIDETAKSIELTVCPYCKQEFATQWYLRKHLIQEHEKNLDERTSFLCLECGEEFTKHQNLRAHVFEKFAHYTTEQLGFVEVSPSTGEGGKDNNLMHLKCTQCSQIFRKITTRLTRIDISEHYMIHLGEPSGRLAFKCRYCDESFRRYDHMRLHICENLKNVLQSGMGKWQEGSNQARLRRRTTAKKDTPVPVVNKKIYMKNIRYVCLKCGISFGKMFLCKRHMFGTHAMNQPSGLEFKIVGKQDDTDIYECTVCEEFTCDYDVNTMLVHARTHTIYDPFQCKLCRMTFAYDADIPGHACVDKEIAKAMKDNKTLRENSLAHMEKFCPKCGQTYLAPSSLTRHRYKAHGMDEPYGLGFEVTAMNNDGVATAYSCKLCATFQLPDKNLSAMLEHARQHLPYKSYRCTLCDERFQLKTEAKLHQCANEIMPNETTSTAENEAGVSHDSFVIKNERLSKMGRFCPKCGRKFEKTFVCQRHMNNVHGMNKPSGLGFEKINDTDTSYRCMACSSFTLDKLDVNLMLDHAREHLQFDSFWCMLCEATFRTKIQAKQHDCADNNRTKETEHSERILDKKLFEKCMRKLCPECNNEMPSMKMWRWHMVKYHAINDINALQMKQTNANLVECLVCQMHVTNKRRQEHRFTHLPYKPLQCKFCCEYFIEVDKAKEHCYDCKKMPADFLTNNESVDKEESKQQTTAGVTKKRKRKAAVKLEEIKGSDDDKDIGEDEVTEEDEDNENNELATKREKKKLHSTEQQSGAIKGISVVLTDDNDYAKFVRISCPLCPDTEFQTNNELSQHFHEAHNSFLENFTIHNTNAVNCKACNKYFNTIYKKNLVNHYLGEIKATCYCCRLCDKNFLYFNTMRTHLLEDHEATIAGQTKDDRVSATLYEGGTAGGSSASTSTSAGNLSGADPLKLTNSDISKVSRTTMAIRTSKTSVFNEFNAYISYACPECNAFFDTSEQWHLHINGEHNFFDNQQLNIEATPDGYKRCKQCQVNISGGVLAEQRHKLTHMKHKSFICTLCLHRSTTLGVLTQHFRRRHFAKGEFKCILCEEVLSTSCAQVEHLKSVHDPEDYPRTLCRICFINFSSFNSLVTHMEIHNPNRVVYDCPYCERSYKYRKEMCAHIQTKHPGREIPSENE